MDKESLLFEKYRSVGVIRGGELYLGHADALRFIEDCRNLGLVILGMEFFATEGKWIIPGRIENYSSVSNEPNAVEYTTARARSLLKGGMPDDETLVTFTICEPTAEEDDV